MVTELKYAKTNTYLIKGKDKYILFDTDWAGTFSLFCKSLKKHGIKVQDIGYLFISHFHPDHMGIAQEIAESGVQIVVMDIQQNFIHNADQIFEKEKRSKFIPIDDSKIRIVSISESRAFLSEIGINGEIFHTPGHSDDSISLYLDDGFLLVGDLNPLYELEAHKGTQIADSWDILLNLKPKVVYYGHAKAAVLDKSTPKTSLEKVSDKEIFSLVKKIMKCIDKGYSVDIIQKKTGADPEFIQDVARMYLTHQNVSVQGILDRIEIKNK